MQKDNTIGLLNREGIADLPLLRTLLTIRQIPKEPSFREMKGSCFINICKFDRFKNPSVKTTRLSELYFRFRIFILFIQMKETVSMNYCNSTSSRKEERWVRLDLIIMTRDIYINSNLNPLAKSTSGNRSTEFKDILPWNISQMITKTVPISTRIVKSYAMKRSIPFSV